MSHPLAQYAVSANCCVQQKKNADLGSMSQCLWLCADKKHESPRQLLHDCWWTGVLWVVRWLIVVFDGNSCGYSVGLGLMIDDRSWLMVGFDDSSCGIVWVRVDWWLALMITAVGQLSKNDWQLTGVTWLMGTGGRVGLLIVCRRPINIYLLSCPVAPTRVQETGVWGRVFPSPTGKGSGEWANFCFVI